MSRHVTVMTIDDAEHYTPAQRQAIIDSYPPHEREARTKGIPSMGSGRVFPITEESLTVAPFQIPAHFVQIIGIDFGWDHPFAAIHCAWDREADVFYVCKEYAARETTPVLHAAAIKPWGEWIPVAWPHDGLQHDKGSGEALKEQYRAQGLNMLNEKATFEDGGKSMRQNGENYARITYQPIDRIESFDYAATGEPVHYDRVGDTLVFWPAITTTVRMRWTGSLTALSADGDTDWLITGHPDLSLYAALLEADLRLDLEEMRPKWQAAYERKLKQLLATDMSLPDAIIPLPSGVPV